VSDVKNHLLGIERDLPRTFPTLAFFHDGGPLEQNLRRVLRAFVCFKTSIGYVQGLSFIVAMLLLYMDEVQAFRCLVNLIDKRGKVGQGFYKLEHSSVTKFVSIFNEYFKNKLPQLYNHMASEQITSEMFLLDWNLTLFSKSLSLESAARIWDCFLVDGESFIVKASLGILRCLSLKIRNRDLVEILPLLTKIDVDTEVLMESISQIRIARLALTLTLTPNPQP
jgi:TBC1 domain family member 14